MSKRSADLSRVLGSHYGDPNTRRTKAEKLAADRAAVGAGLTAGTRALAEMVEKNPHYPLTEQQRREVGAYLAYRNTQQDNEGEDR